MRKLLVAVVAVIALCLPGKALATALPFTGVFALQIGTLQPIPVAGSQTATLNGSAAHAHLDSLNLPGSTFAVLMTQPLNSLLQFGFAMAVGLLLDTFIIRGVLVPALFLLIGPRVWFPGRRLN